jgi:AhpD family alkylhydroperoxidase
MEARIPSPALSVPGAFEAIQALSAAATKAGRTSGLTRGFTELVNLRVSQVNGCAVCLDMHTRGAKQAGEAEQRLNTVAAWRESSYFSEAEKAALALAEAVTRLADRPDPVPDDVFAAAAKHYDEAALAALLTHVAVINVWNRLNVATAQQAGEWTAQWVSQEG